MADIKNTNADIAFGWDDEFDLRETFTLLSEQDCPFEVLKMEKARYDGGAKIPACPMAILTLRLTGVEGETTITDRLYLHSKMQSKLSQFFISIGQAKEGDAVIRPRWDELVGAAGICHVTVREYTKQSGPHAGETGQANQIDRYLRPGAAPSAPRPAAQPQQLSWSGRGF